MRLLIDNWISVRWEGGLKQISLQKLLTTATPYHLALPRDDMELATLQLLVSLVQVVAQPPSAAALRQRAQSPMSEAEYGELIEGYADSFDLQHSSKPFMQVIDPKAKETTPIQKLYIGLPEGVNHAFFNDPGEISLVCGSCAAIALFNQASNAPGFSGRHKAGLRGGGKLNTFLSGKDLRETLWLNVLHSGAAKELLPDADNDVLCWESPITAGERITAQKIGLRRGLFWQPLRLKLEATELDAPVSCGHCGLNTETAYSGFWCETDFKFEVQGLWPHPHSPRCWNIKKQERDNERYLSFNQLTPGWTQLNQYALSYETAKDGNVRAPVIDQFEDVFLDQTHDRMVLLVAGYATKPPQPIILARRHELFSMPSDWDDKKIWVEKSIKSALAVNGLLGKTTFMFSESVFGEKKKRNKVVSKKLKEKSQRIFCQDTEAEVHKLLQTFGCRKESRKVSEDFLYLCKQSARNIFEELSRPYLHSPEGLKQYAIDKRSLNSGLKKIEL